MRQRLADSVAALSTQDCPARGAGGAGQGVCASRAQHRSLLIAATQAQANIDALLLKLDAEDADRGRRELERDLMEQAREEEFRLAQLAGPRVGSTWRSTRAAGRANVLTPALHARNAAARPFGDNLFVGH